MHYRMKQKNLLTQNEQTENHNDNFIVSLLTHAKPCSALTKTDREVRSLCFPVCVVMDYLEKSITDANACQMIFTLTRNAIANANSAVAGNTIHATD